MKVARARYVGSMRHHSRACPSGRTYTFKRSSSGSEWVDIEDPRDARALERARNVELDWTAIGRLRAKVAEGSDAIQAVLDESYQYKRSLATKLGLEFDGTPDQESLDEALQDHIEDLHERGEL